MFLLYLLSLLTNLAAAPVYSRTYLRGLQQNEMIATAIIHIERIVLATAHQGLTHFTTQPFSCDWYSEEANDRPLNLRSPEIYRLNIDREKCETIVYEVRKAVSQLFPDSDLTYDASTHQYTLSWT